ncbi:Putative NAD-dependent epimerase/dehydratase, NAD(P)-binding domain superfamily [Septoria linicola]|uniref:NAD-dependent epimerase/dehydratase, NAD(P)-binding domain superfamily n=1 Tax=Septoria linicola TaxID=215465 RepID=A0A9Q9AS62_9PEZI|nr:Putative NAD-dependent epimerase/dehydratase, NAD(P)-binding domain superfamily [Septoria linicola]
MTNSASSQLVLVTGGSGHLGSHCVLQLLQKGYQVRTTVRTQSRVEDAKAKYRHGGATDEQISAIEIVILDLVNDTDSAWTKACTGAKYLLHTAGLIATGKEKDVNELLIPLKDGTLRVLRAAKAAGVHKVVFTSSVAAIAQGHGPKRGKSQPFTEEDWTDLSDKKEKLHVYPRAKTIQEQAAWEYIKSEEGEGLEMTVINPVAMYGPSLSKEFASSLKLIGILLGGMPGVPQYGTGMVDVRDVAELHVKAMESEAANGQRYLAISGTSKEVESQDAVCDFVSMISSAEILRNGLPVERTSKIPTRTLPNFVMRAAGYFDPVVGVCLPDLGKELAGSFAKARKELDWKPRTVEEALLSSANSLIEFGAV